MRGHFVRRIADEHERDRAGTRLLVAGEPLDELERALAGIDPSDAHEVRPLPQPGHLCRRNRRVVDLDADPGDERRALDAESASHERGLLLGEEAVSVGEAEEPFVNAEAKRRFVVRARVEHDREAPGERRDRVERGEVQVGQHDGRVEPSRVVLQPRRETVEAWPLLGQPRMLHVRRSGQPPVRRAHRDRGEPFDVARRDRREAMHDHAKVVAGPRGKDVGPVEVADRAAGHDLDGVTPRRHPRGERPAGALGAARGLLAVAGHDIEQPHAVLT